jgi:hypothetical protein
MPPALPIQLISSLLSPAIFDHSEQPPTPPLPPALLNCRSLLTKKYPHPLTLHALRNRLLHVCLRPTLIRNHFLGRAMHHGCVAGANRGGGQRPGGGRHRQAIGGAGGLLHPRAGHRRRAVLVRPRRVPGKVVRRLPLPALGWRASIAGGFRQMFEGRRPDSGEPLGRPHGRNAVPAFAWCRGRPRATRSCTAWAARPPAVRCSGRIIHDLPDHRADVTSQG